MAFYTHAIFNDAAEQETGLPAWQQRYTQVSSGIYRGRNDYLSIRGLTITRERIDAVVAQTFWAPADQVIFSFTIDPDSRWRVDGGMFNGAQCFVARGGHERAGCCERGYDVVMVCISSDRLPWNVEAMPSLQTIVGTAVDACRHWLLALLDNAARGAMFSPPQMDELLPSIVIDQLTNIYMSAKARRALASSRSATIYRRATRLLADPEGGVMTLSDLSDSLGVSQEVARLAFKDAVGISANRWFVLQRIDGARRDLLKSDPDATTVASVAMKWRFWHLGRFASEYARQFGELPSDTLRRPTSSIRA